MASENGPDLDGARAAIEALMDDSCVIRWDAKGRNDDDYDHATGKRIRPNPQDAVVYDASTTGFAGRSLADDEHLGGKCKFQVASAAQIPRNLQEGGAQIQTEFYNVGLPWDAPIPANGSEILVTSSRRDPDLVGRTLIVRLSRFGTFLVSRKLLAELRAPSL